MTKRAKRMRKALESMAWDCGDQYSSRDCLKCGDRASSYEAKFCSNCGTKLSPVKTEADGATVTQLERAIAYALGETKQP